MFPFLSFFITLPPSIRLYLILLNCSVNVSLVYKHVRVCVLSGCSRGPSPLTMGAQDTLPVAAAFTETVSAYFKGADPNKYVLPYLQNHLN